MRPREKGGAMNASTITLTMRLRGFSYGTATLWCDETRGECVIPLGGGWLDEPHRFGDVYRITVELLGNDRDERMARMDEEDRWTEERA